MKKDKIRDPIIAEIRDRFREASDAVDSLYDMAVDDLQFLDGNHWPEAIQKQRARDGRPCMTINKLPTYCDQVTGEIRQNNPAIKIVPVDSESDPETAEVLTGLIRNIEHQSDAEIAYDTALESAVQSGIGAFRIITEYAADDVFDLDIRIRRIKNPLTVYWDPACQNWDKSDARYCIVTERIGRDKFVELYPDAAIQDADGNRDKDPNWSADKSVRVAEYFRKKVKKRTLYLLRHPETGEESVHWERFEPMELVRSREVETTTLEWYKTNGVEILEGPVEWPGTLIPIIMVYGKELNIEGQSIYRGIVRNAKDPARLYNFSRSYNAEVTALAPKAPYIGTPAMFGNHMSAWKQANRSNLPFLMFDPDPKMPGLSPQRTPPITQNTGILTELQIGDQEMHDCTGMQQASFGEKSNEKSGTAINARKREGFVANFVFSDNLARAMRYAGRVIIELIPKIYDTERIVRITGIDGKEKQVTLNAPFMDQEAKRPKLFDITTGKYDVVVEVGPSYATQREEAVDGMVQLFAALPDQARMLVADLLVKNLDWPGAGEIESRLKKLLPPGMAGDDGDAPPPAAPPQPDPAQMLEMEKTKAEIQETLMKVQKIQAEVDKILAETRGKRHEVASKEMGLDVLQNQQGQQGNSAPF